MVPIKPVIAFAFLFSVNLTAWAHSEKPQHGVSLELELVAATSEVDCLRIHLHADAAIQINDLSLLNAQLSSDSRVDCAALWQETEEQSITLYRTLQHQTITTPIKVTVTWQQDGDYFSQTGFWPEISRTEAKNQLRSQPTEREGEAEGLHIIRINPAQ